MRREHGGGDHVIQDVLSPPGRWSHRRAGPAASQQRRHGGEEVPQAPGRIAVDRSLRPPVEMGRPNRSAMVSATLRLGRCSRPSRQATLARTGPVAERRSHPIGEGGDSDPSAATAPGVSPVLGHHPGFSFGSSTTWRAAKPASVPAPSRSAPQPRHSAGRWSITSSGLADISAPAPAPPACLPGRRRLAPPDCLRRWRSSAWRWRSAAESRDGGRPEFPEF